MPPCSPLPPPSPHPSFRKGEEQLNPPHFLLPILYLFLFYISYSIFISSKLRIIHDRCTIQDLQAGKLSLGTPEFASQVLRTGTFVFRTSPSNSPFENFGTVFSLTITGLPQENSLLSGVSNGQMDWPTFNELAKKMVGFCFFNPPPPPPYHINNPLSCCSPTSSWSLRRAFVSLCPSPLFLFFV